MNRFLVYALGLLFSVGAAADKPAAKPCQAGVKGSFAINIPVGKDCLKACIAGARKQHPECPESRFDWPLVFAPRKGDILLCSCGYTINKSPGGRPQVAKDFKKTPADSGASAD